MPTATSGRPRVLAFVRSWAADRTSALELSAMRAELRGLGAELLVYSDTGLWSFGPDDVVEHTRACQPLEVESLAREYAFDPACDAVFVLDQAGEVRFRHLATGALETTLADALTAAGQALVAGAEPPLRFNRREWALTSLCTGFALALFGCKPKKREDKKVEPTQEAQVPPPAEYDIQLNVNGKDHPLKVEARVSLLDALRERLVLTGTKKGCDHGQCGACTVHLDGRRALSCMTLAVMAQGQKITTIEGLARGDELHPVQAAFVEHDGFQCGYCTPGQIMSAVALLAEGRARTDDEVREHMSGNLCRCGAYPNIVAAVQSARGDTEEPLKRGKGA
jgi:xanthine dehydrogenase YagT iron-sulfur-binding subunit